MQTKSLKLIKCTNLKQNNHNFLHHFTMCGTGGVYKKIPEKSLQNSSYGYWSIPSLLLSHERSKSNTQRKKAWMLWKTFGQCWARCGIPLHLPILGAVKYAHRPIGPLCLPAQCNLPAYHTSTNWRQRWSIKWPLFMLSTLFFTLTLYFTSSVSSHLTCSCTKHLAPLLSCSLHVFSSSISNHTHTRRHTSASTLSHTHAHTMGLRFRGSYDTIQILLAAYAEKCVLCKAISLRSPDFPCQSALIRMAQGGLCQQSYVSAGGASGPP